MNNIWLTAIALLLIVISAGLMYLYLTYRQKESPRKKDFFVIVYSKRDLLISVVAFIISTLTYVYSFFVMDVVFLEALMNAETALWLLILGYIDLKEKIIPNQLILAGIVFWAILTCVEILFAPSSWLQILVYSIFGGGVCGGILFIIALILKSALGMGDVKMLFVIGLLYGLFDTYTILLSSILIMAVVAIVLLIAKKVTRKTAIPMAPFMALGFLVNVLMGI